MISIHFLDKGWIFVARNGAYRGYKHNELTPGLCMITIHGVVVSMYVPSTYTHRGFLYGATMFFFISFFDMFFFIS